jgi:hypothetical protein
MIARADYQIQSSNADHGDKLGAAFQMSHIGETCTVAAIPF